ncbi:MAG: hypothetical protein RKP20_17415 [Candidatus Competibacter sp.]|nr:hypothetical protein [Candidatus Competibacter sp.]
MKWYPNENRFQELFSRNHHSTAAGRSESHAIVLGLTQTSESAGTAIQAIDATTAKRDAVAGSETKVMEVIGAMGRPGSEPADVGGRRSAGRKGISSEPMVSGDIIN